jgi:hypothetical protein
MNSCFEKKKKLLIDFVNVETDSGLQSKVRDGAEEKGKRGQNTQFSTPKNGAILSFTPH